MNSTAPAVTKNYELLVIFAGSLKESARDAALAKWEKEIGALGKIENKVVWNARPLAYKIKREKVGTYLILHVAGDPTKIAELENALRIEPSVLRYLIYTTPKNYAWCQYEPADLEYDLAKIRASEEDTESAEPTKSTKPAAPKAAPVKRAALPISKTAETGKDRPAVKKEAPAKSSEENKKKLDNLLDEL